LLDGLAKADAGVDSDSILIDAGAASNVQ